MRNASMEVSKMIAVQGQYDHGRLHLAEEAPMEKADVIVIFPEGEAIKEAQMSKKMARELFDEFTGSITRVIDEKSERVGALDCRCSAPSAKS